MVVDTIFGIEAVDAAVVSLDFDIERCVRRCLVERQTAGTTLRGGISFEGIWRLWRRMKPRRCATEARQEASSQVMPRITGTESSVATKIVSRATITPRSYRIAKVKTFCAVGSAAITVTASKS
jgi:hypothetical protein